MNRLPTLTTRQSVVTGSVFLVLCLIVLSVALWLSSSPNSLPVDAQVPAESAVPQSISTETPPLSTQNDLSLASTTSETLQKNEESLPDTAAKEKAAAAINKAPVATSNPVVPAPTKTPVTATEVSTPQKPTIVISELLKGHNAIRKEKGLSPLTWSNKLAEDAQAWSEVLQNEGCTMRHNYTSGYGENLYWQKQNGGSVAKMISDEATANTAWITEEKYYSYTDNTCQAGKQCGHYTQIVSANTTQVGCGISSCIVGESRTDIWVCRYNPQGNIIGQKPY